MNILAIDIAGTSIKYAVMDACKCVPVEIGQRRRKEGKN